MVSFMEYLVERVLYASRDTVLVTEWPAVSFTNTFTSKVPAADGSQLSEVTLDDLQLEGSPTYVMVKAPDPPAAETLR